MLHNDSIDFEDLRNCVSADAVPMRVGIDLKDIWIPSELLPNRTTAIDFNKGGIFHTLERPNILDKFSVYFDKELEISNFSTTEGTATEVDKNINTLEEKSQTSSQSHSLENVSSLIDDNIYLPEKLANISNDKNHQIMKSSIITRDSLEEIFYSEEKLNEVVELEGNEKPELTQLYADLLDLDNTEQKVSESDIPKCPNDAVIELPIAYQRPEREEITSKHKTQKEKKYKKKPAKNNLHLTEFLQIVNGGDYEEPEKDEFYEDLVRRGLCKPMEQSVENVAEFPDYYELSDMEFLTHPKDIDIQEQSRLSNFAKAECKIVMEPMEQSVENVAKFPDYYELSEMEFLTHPEDIEIQERSRLSNFAKAECKIVVPTCEGKKKIESVEVEPETLNESTTTIIIENIPKNVTRENIESIVMGYGQLKKLSLKSCGKFLTAQLEMNFECEVDWIVECLNGSEPFGASSDGVTLKCYQL